MIDWMSDVLSADLVRQGGAGAHPGLSRQPKGKAKRLYVGPQPRPFAGIARTFRPSELDEARGPEARSKARDDHRPILEDHRRHVVRPLGFGGLDMIAALGDDRPLFEIGRASCREKGG